ncbi:MAG: hypothetical protein OXG44_02780 [Gammaproteobacteria bacterium]|nr:hypothetical protein [Gammaproteobacteria bacterium]
MALDLDDARSANLDAGDGIFAGERHAARAAARPPMSGRARPVDGYDSAYHPERRGRQTANE